MSNYNKPSLKTLRNRAISDINAYLKGADANLRRRVLNIYAAIMAGIGDEILRRVEFLIKQIFITSADDEYLLKHGQTRSFPRKKAEKASGSIVFEHSIPGSIVPAGTTIKRSDNILYTSTEDAIVNAEGIVTIPVTAENVGIDGNTTRGTIFSFISPIAGVNNQGISQNALIGGADIEKIEEYKERLKFYIQNPPSGGSQTDYENWTKEVSGVTRAWCYPTEMGIGTVTIRFMMDNTYNNGIPAAADVATVTEHISSLRPVTAIVYVAAPIADTIDFVFANLSPDTSDAREAVETNLKTLIQSSFVEPGAILRLSKIRAAISNATGNEDFDLITPSNDIECDIGHIPVLGTITYQE
jgi:uncharacterized phage protein gp47/JayE